MHLKPKERTIAELEHSLQYEIQSERHISIVELLASISANTKVDDMTNSTDTTVDGGRANRRPFTVISPYETDGMLQIGMTPLLYGKDVSLTMSTLNLSSGSIGSVKTLSDSGFGETDGKMKWGGKKLHMAVLDCENHPDLGATSFHVYLGTCYLQRKCLWDFAVMFRHGTSAYTWPGYFAVLQCPFCANIATPSDDTQYVMIIQVLQQRVTLHQNNGDRAQQQAQAHSSRFMPRLCCLECFLGSMNFPDDGSDERATILDYTILPGSATVAARNPTTYRAYNFMLHFESSGTSAAFSKYYCQTLAHVSSESGQYKARISKSSTKANRGQPVLKMKGIQRQTCSNCGLISKKCNTNACGGCERVYYCNRQCQSQNWRLHKKDCQQFQNEKQHGEESTRPRLPQPSMFLNVRKKRKTDNTDDSSENNDGEEEQCPQCKIKSIHGAGCPIMCIVCGQFVACGSCATTAAYGGYNARQEVMFFFCVSCSKEKKTHKILPGTSLQRLLDDPDTGHRATLYARLLLAQIMLNNTVEHTGVRQDTEAAKKEYMWLANDLDYPPAELAIGSFHDPESHHAVEYWDGPLPLHLLDDNDAFDTHHNFPFRADAKLAKQYYDRAAGHHRFSTALQTLGVSYKNGSALYPQNTTLAISYLTEAAEMGDPLAANSVGAMYCTNGDLTAGMKYFRQAANHGLLQSMFMIGQFGAKHQEFKEEGRTWVKKLIEEDWEPTRYEHYGIWVSVCQFYGISLP